MPRVKAKFKPEQVVVCVESFVTSILPSGPFPVPAGTRLLGKHPVVEACAQFFVPDGTPQDEVARARVQIYQDAEADLPPPAPPQTRVEQRIPDEDALVNIHNGQRAHKKSDAAKARPENYVPVVPAGLSRKNALLATATMSEVGLDGSPSRTVYAGQWVARDDPFVTLHPESFELPPLERSAE